MSSRFFAAVMAGLLAIGCGGAGSGGPAGVGTSTCVGTRVVTAKRVVRLSEHQLFNAYASLFGAGEPGREILHPVAVTIFGGLISATLLDALLTPILFLWFGAEPLRRLEAARAGAGPAPAEAY